MGAGNDQTSWERRVRFKCTGNERMRKDLGFSLD